MQPHSHAVPAAPPRDVGGIAIDWLFESPTVRLTRWTSLVRDRDVTTERQQFWHVVGFPHRGSYVLQSEGEAALIDVNSIAFFNPLGVYLLAVLTSQSSSLFRSSNRSPADRGPAVRPRPPSTSWKNSATCL
jgi:hypothetical protein